MKFFRKLLIWGAGVFLLFFVVIFGAARVVEASASGRLYTDQAKIPQRDTGVILGCSPFVHGGYHNLYFQSRIEAAVRLYQAEKITFLLVSGDNHIVGYDETTAMKDALVAAGVPQERIVCDYAGFRTLDSVVRAKEVFGQQKITVISQAFHNQRAIFLAGNYGLDAIGYNACEVDLRWGLRTRLREYFARVKAVFDVLAGTQPKFLGPKVNISAGVELSWPLLPVPRLKMAGSALPPEEKRPNTGLGATKAIRSRLMSEAPLL